MYARSTTPDKGPASVALDRALEQYGKRPTAPGFEKVWRMAWLQNPELEHMTPSAWTSRERGMANMLAQYLGGGREAAEKIASAVVHWQQFAKVVLDDTGWKKLGRRPTLALLHLHRDTLADWQVPGNCADVGTQDELEGFTHR